MSVKLLFILSAILAVILIGGAIFLMSQPPAGLINAGERSNIINFDDCAQAGYPIMETYPAQCKTPDGRNFIQRVMSPPPEIISGQQSLFYEDKQFGFSFWYAGGSQIRKDNLAGYLSLTRNGLVGIFLSPALFSGTNLGEAAVVVGIDPAADKTAKCEQPNIDNNEKDLGSATIGQAQFHKFSAVGVGAGNIYESTIYRTGQFGSCYEIVELLHSGNIGNYPPGAVKEFDRTKFSGLLEKIVQTFNFLNQLASGVFGKISLGPVCPVEKIPSDPNCSARAYQTTVEVTGANGFAQKISSDADGLFRLTLEPGLYTFTAKGGQVLPRCAAQTVAIKPNSFISLNISCDSGLR